MGHSSTPGPLAKAWVEYWSAVAKDPNYIEKLTRFAEEKTFGTILALKVKGGDGYNNNSEIAPGLWLDSYLSVERRKRIMTDLSSALHLDTRVIYLTAGIEEDSTRHSETEQDSKPAILPSLTKIVPSPPLLVPKPAIVIPLT